MKKIGRYEIVEELGRGAMGVVYKASDPTIGRMVAIKVLSLDPAADDKVPGARDIFVREARAAGRLSHPGIVTIHDALEDPESRTNYIVMEFVAGRTLESILLTSPQLGTEKSLDIIHQIAEALDYAHSQKIVHRDLKPANILLTEDGRVKITDFGIAKIAAREGALRTVAVMGTPSFMSPEQVRGGEVDSRSDLFSLGILHFLMLTGQKPFSGDTATVMFKVAFEDPLLPSRLNPELGPGHDYLILRCLVKDPKKRYASARDFLNDLEDVRQGRAPRSQQGFPTTELRVGDRTLISRRPLVAPLEMRPPAEVRVHRRGVFFLGGALLAVLVILGVWGLRREEAPPSPPPSAQSEVVEGAARKKQPGERGKGQGKSTATKPAVPPAGATRVITLRCRHELEEGTLTVTSGSKVILQVELKGKKRRGFIGIRGGFSGIFSRPISLPAEERPTVVRVRSVDGSVDLARAAPPPPDAASDILEVVAEKKRLSMVWKAGKRPSP